MRLLDQLRSNKRVKILFFTLPATVYLGIFFIIPFLFLIWISFWRTELLHLIPTWSLESWLSVFYYPGIIPVLFKTLRIATTVTIITFILGYPFAYYLAFKVSGYRQTVLSLALVFPFFVGLIPRTYAWRVLLGVDGAINSFLILIHVIDEPLMFLLFTEYAFQIVLVYNYLLLMVFPVFISMQRIDRRLFEASADLGAGLLRTLTKIVIPLSMPGIMAGSIFVFISVLTVYVEPILIGGKEGFMFANLIVLQFGPAMQWPTGAAMGIIMLTIVIILCSMFIKLVGLEKIFRM